MGWCTEVSYAALVTGKFINRGFLNGPVCPVYGFGVVIVLGCLTPLSENLLILFIGSVILTSILEWLTGFVLEKLFHQRWWDYSDQPFNLNGYICLRFSIAWGLACVFVVRLLHPTILGLIWLIPHFAGMWRLQTYEQFGGTWLSDYVPNRLGGFLPTQQERQKPDCELIGQDGNIFALIGIASRTLRQNGMAKQAKEMQDRIMGGDCPSYDAALGIIGEYVNITGPDGPEQNYFPDMTM